MNHVALSLNMYLKCITISKRTICAYLITLQILFSYKRILGVRKNSRFFFPVWHSTRVRTENILERVTICILPQQQCVCISRGACIISTSYKHFKRVQLHLHGHENPGNYLESRNNNIATLRKLIFICNNYT